MAEAEGAGELALEEQRVREVTEAAEWRLIVDVIVQKGADARVGWVCGIRGGVNAVAVFPEGERAAMLDVAELLVPGEVDDLGVPGDADGREGDGTEAHGETGARAGDDGSGTSGRSAGGCGRGIGAGRRRSEGGLFDAGFLPGGHEAWEIFRIGEEEEDELDGIGEPLLGVKGVAHVCG